MRISTSRYMRFKMKINTCKNCLYCTDTVETLEHIFLTCKISNDFRLLLNDFISLHIDRSYRDENKYFFICCNHENDIINYMNMAGKWFISRCFQKEETPTWIHFTRLVNKLLCGEKRVIKERLLECL